MLNQCIRCFLVLGLVGFLSGSLMVYGGELTNETKKLSSEAKGLETLMKDFEDILGMGDIKQAKNLSFKISRYLKALEGIGQLGRKVEKLEADYEKAKSELSNIQDMTKTYQSEAEASKMQKVELDTRIAELEKKYNEERQKLINAESRAKNNEINLDSCQSRLTNLQSSLNSFQSRSDQAERDLAGCRSELDLLKKDSQKNSTGSTL